MRELRPELMGAAIGGWAGLAIGLGLMILGYGGWLGMNTPGDAFAAAVLAGATGGMGLGTLLGAIRDEAKGYIGPIDP